MTPTVYIYRYYHLLYDTYIYLYVYTITYWYMTPTAIDTEIVIKCRRESHCCRCAAMWAPSMQKVKGVSRMQPQQAEATNMEILKTC